MEYLIHEILLTEDQHLDDWEILLGVCFLLE